jgi:poly-gamma-glutamate capsule biosynthesis protein CapA/YwtB (metallophosphatase superfamily)
VMYFGGDTLIGRLWTDPSMPSAAMDWVVERIREFTGGFPLVVNLEGVVLDQSPIGAKDGQHLMSSRIALPVLKKLGVVAVTTANNHSYDFGLEAFDRSARSLEASGIRVLQHGDLAGFGAVNLLPLTFKRSNFFDHAFIQTPSQLESICALQKASPLIVLPHWGDEYTDTGGAFESRTLEKLTQCGVSAVIGAHTHRASEKVQLRAGGALQSVFSLGNLIFDQTGADVSGSLVELRAFRQGTIALRVIPIPNFYEMSNPSK